jgi:hypothetical protein
MQIFMLIAMYCSMIFSITLNDKSQAAMKVQVK